MLFLEACDILFSNVIKAHNPVGESTCLVTLTPMLDPAPNFQSQEKASPESFILSLVLLGLDRLTSTHRTRCLKIALERERIVFTTECSLIILEDDKDEAVDHKPAVLPEERKESLDLVKRNHLREQSHDPILAQDEYLNALLLEMLRELRQFLFHQHFDNFAVIIQTW